VGGPWPEAVELAEVGDEPIEADAAVQPDGVGGDGPGEGTDGAGPCPGEPQVVEAGDGEGLRCREGVAQAHGRQPGDPPAEPLDQPPADRVGGGDADLLPDDRAHAGLERVEGARRAHARPAAQQRPQDRVGGQPTGRLLHVEVEVGDAPGAGDQVRQLLPVRQVGTEQEVLLPSPGQLHHARVAAHRDGPPVGPVADVLDAGNRPAAR
jgi:hypothetical protein